MRTFNRLLLTGLFALAPMVAIAANSAPSGDPEVTIRTKGDKTIQEYRQNGFLYAIKVTKKGFPPYFLIRADGTDANFIRSDDPKMLIPAWKIFEWK